MTPTKEVITVALLVSDAIVRGVPSQKYSCHAILASAYRAKCAEAEELRGLINEILPVGDIADGLAPYYIESDTIHRMRKALEGKA